MYKVFILLLLPFISYSQTCYDSSYSRFSFTPSLISTPSQQICFGNSIEINTSNLGQKYCSNLNLINGKAVVKPIQTTTYNLYSIRQTPNLIKNGNFNQGNIDFQSDYTPNTYIHYSGYYGVYNNPRLLHATMRECVDHTNPAIKGNMLCANGATETNKRVWYQTIKTTRNTTYNFSYWSLNILNDLSGKLRIWVDNVPIDTAMRITGYCQWQQYKTTIHSGNRDSITIAIVDEELEASDNDFAIDDIELYTTYLEYDSVTITINQPKTIYDTLRACNSIEGYTSSGIYKDTLKSVLNCDSVYRIRTVIINSFQPTVKVCFYSGCNYFPLGGIIYTQTGIYKDTLKSYQGCDSLYLENHITITKFPTVINSDSITSCTYLVHQGIMYFETKIWRDTLRTTTGCDSVVNIFSIIISPPAKVFSNTIISCEPVTHLGITYDSSIIKSDTLSGYRGCDSVINYIEIVIGKPSVTIRDTINSCIPSLTTIDTLYSLLGCDSLIKITVYKTPPVIRDTVYKTVCNGETYNGYNSTGTYFNALQYVSGCDSAVTVLYLTVKPLIIVNSSITVCSGGYTIQFGDTIRQSGIYTDTLRYNSGCDSLIKNINVTFRVHTTENITLQPTCAASLTLPNNQVVFTSGIYRHKIPSVAGCDSLTRNYQVTFFKPKLVVSKSNDVDCSKYFTQLNVTGANSYKWTPSNSLNRSDISNPKATPIQSTTYKVTGQANGCEVTDSVIVKVDKSNGAVTKLLPSAFTPNNDWKNDCYSIRSLGYVQDLEFSIYNRWGEQVFYTKDLNNCWNGTYKGKPQDTGTFIYVVRGSNLCGDITSKGTIVLLR